MLFFDIVVGHDNDIIFFFKQKTAYEIGLGIPAEPLFRSFVNVFSHIETNSHITGSFKRLTFSINSPQPTRTGKSVLRVANCDGQTVTIRPRNLQAMQLPAIAYPTTKIRVNATCRKSPHKVPRMEMKTAISCTILRHTKILIAVGV